MAVRKDQIYLQALMDAERPARMVGLFTGHAMKPPDLQRLVNACLGSMRQEDPGASLTLSPLGSGSPQGAAQRTWRITVAGTAESAPHDCLVQVFEMRDPESPHRALLDHIGGRDQELSQAASHLQQNAQTYVSTASGKLDEQERSHPLQNLASLISSGRGAAIVDPAPPIVINAPRERADPMELS